MRREYPDLQNITIGLSVGSSVEHRSVEVALLGTLSESHVTATIRVTRICLAAGRERKPIRQLYRAVKGLFESNGIYGRVITSLGAAGTRNMIPCCWFALIVAGRSSWLSLIRLDHCPVVQ